MNRKVRRMKNRGTVKRGRMNRIMTERSGFTLLEIMISFVVLSIAVLSAVYVLEYGQKVSVDCRKTLIALNAARSTLEVVKNTPLAGVPGIATAGLVPAELTNGAVVITTDPSNLAGAQFAVVTVTVSWRGTSNRLNSLQVSTIRSAF